MFCSEFLFADVANLIKVMETHTGCAVTVHNVLECEWDPRKREWLKVFGKPKMLMKDVSELSGCVAFNYMREEDDDIPEGLFLYTYGWSCKDLSALNNFSQEWKADCVQTGRGTTGVTWRGNYGYVLKTKPPLVVAENVVAARRGANYQKVLQEFKEAGYYVGDLNLNSGDCGFPQDRVRSYFVCVRQDLATASWAEEFLAVTEDLKLLEPVPLSRFVLPDTHSYVVRVMDERKAQKMKKGMKSVKAKTKAKAKVKVRCGKKWISDHWRLRCQLGMRTAPAEEPQQFTDMAEANGMCDRERDLLRLVLDAPTTRKEPLKSVELKHSAPRVVKLGQRRREDCTSCLLPASKMMVFPPVAGSTRYLTGLEALSVQGIPNSFHEATQVLNDREYMSLAGNAFNAGSWSLVVIAALATMDLSRM